MCTFVLLCLAMPFGSGRQFIFNLSVVCVDAPAWAKEVDFTILIFLRCVFLFLVSSALNPLTNVNVPILPNDEIEGPQESLVDGGM